MLESAHRVPVRQAVDRQQRDPGQWIHGTRPATPGSCSRPHAVHTGPHCLEE
ncbi:hypothetical protein DPMN_119689 [Dreissena polymorpha]|uniref:Uncharacterized protein n=1 Tax=Dreissena polymorpha TaxID=45954 RepID=A0A9D4GJM3_DREPO|nr:hypothetical protein DPMN_119689 [Dreissena polymorpha]